MLTGRARTPAVRGASVLGMLALLAVSAGLVGCGGGDPDPRDAPQVTLPPSRPASAATDGRIGGLHPAPPASSTPPAAVAPADGVALCGRLRATATWTAAPGGRPPAATTDACRWDSAPPGDVAVVLTSIEDARAMIEQYQREHEVVDVLEGVGQAGLLTTDGARWTVAVVLDGALLEIGPAPRAVVEDLARHLGPELAPPM